MNLAKINLNLLVALNALLTERNVTKAGRKVFVSQSAMSASLNQLRKLFHDDLLTRKAGGMIPTRLGQELIIPVKQILAQIDNVISGVQEFNPPELERTFMLGVSEPMELMLACALYQHLEEFAPKVKIVFKNFNSLYDRILIREGQVDLAIGAWSDGIPSWLKRELLYKETYVCVMRKSHPLTQSKLTEEIYLQQKAAGIFMPEGEMEEQNTAITLSHNLALFDLLKRTDLIATVPKKFAELFLHRYNLVMQKVPVDLPAQPIYQLWANRLENDRELTWLRNIVKKII